MWSETAPGNPRAGKAIPGQMPLSFTAAIKKCHTTLSIPTELIFLMLLGGFWLWQQLLVHSAA